MKERGVLNGASPISETSVAHVRDRRRYTFGGSGAYVRDALRYTFGVAFFIFRTTRLMD